MSVLLAILILHVGAYMALDLLLGLVPSTALRIGVSLSAFVVTFLAWPAWLRRQGASIEAAIRRGLGLSVRFYAPVAVEIGTSAGLSIVEGVTSNDLVLVILSGLLLIAALVGIWACTVQASRTPTSPV